MKANNTAAAKKNGEDKPGKGRQGRFAIKATMSVEVDGEKQNFSFDTDVTVTTEEIQYTIRKIAGGIAQVASKIAAEGKTDKRTVGFAPAPVA